MSNEVLSYHTKQLPLLYSGDHIKAKKACPEILAELLTDDLDFHNYDSAYAAHNFHSFPAKFPPQLPLKFILSLTGEGDVVLDPMMGSGTTILEAFLTERRAIGFDIDPLAVKIAKVKTTYIRRDDLIKHCRSILRNARNQVRHENDYLKERIVSHWDRKSKQFVDYWFAYETQLELIALLSQIEGVKDAKIRRFFELAFSATIITKSGGVSLAFDLGHTRPHKAKVVLNREDRIIMRKRCGENNAARIKFLTKKLRSAIDEFEKRCIQNIKGLADKDKGKIEPVIDFGNAQDLPLENESVDLIVTSPPYASNAIDYMRAHKFSLIWLGYPIEQLSSKRKEYIGGEDTKGRGFEELPRNTMNVITQLTGRDEKRGKVLHRYYSEMKRALKEMYRVLRTRRVAIVVVGNSIIRGQDTMTQHCLAEIGRSLGFQVPEIGTRRLDRDRRMLPSGAEPDTSSQIQRRMHEEYVIGFYKS